MHPARSVEWRGFAASATGTSHADRAVDCQDAHALVALEGGGLVIAVADGAGSASRAEDGAWAAVDAAVRAAADAANQGAGQVAGEGGVAGELDGGDGAAGGSARAGVVAARHALEELAERIAGDEGEGQPRLGDLACTLLVAVLTGDRIEAAQVGDGAIVARRAGSFEVLAAGERGEFVNETCFVTSSGWSDDLRCESAAGVDAVAVMTDGLQMLALDMSDGSAHAAFFEPLLAWASGADPDGRDLVVFLGSDKVNTRTDDDKTLALAVRVAGR